MIKLTDSFKLPLDAATRRMAILAMSGAGKSNTAVVIAEELYRNRVPWVAVDPKGDWYGVRSNATGDGPGLPIPVFGGLHGDVPLEARAGKMMAQLIVEERMTCVLDVSEFDTRADMFRFLSDFGEELLKKNREPLHLFLEEADDYLPQNGTGAVGTCLGVWQRVVKRGRFRGIGSTLITQRSAAINKDALNMAEALFAMRNFAPHDVKAIAGWVQHNGAGKEILATLSELKDGECWIVSPAWLRKTERIHPRRRETFDSGATPDFKRGKTSRVPKTLADIDLDSVRERMRTTIEKAKAEDPVELRKKIAQLERDLRQQPKETIVTKPVVDEDAVARAVESATGPLVLRIDSLESRLMRAREDLLAAADYMKEAVDEPKKASQYPRTRPAKPASPPPRAQAPAPQPRPATANTSRVTPEGVTSRHLKILNAVAWWDAIGVDRPHKLQVAFMSQYKASNGNFKNLIGALRSAGLIEYPEPSLVRMTDGGRALADVPGTPRTLDALHATVYASIEPRRAALLKPIIDTYPEALTIEELCALTGHTPSNGNFKNLRGSLRTLGLIEYPAPGAVIATALLFPEGLR